MLGAMNSEFAAARLKAAVVYSKWRGWWRPCNPPLGSGRGFVGGLMVLACFGFQLCRAQSSAPHPPPLAEQRNALAWTKLLNAVDLTGWMPVSFGGEGEVSCRNGVVTLPRGQPFTGLRFTNPVPTLNYEIRLEARRVGGSDFFCGLTVPVDASHCSLIVGGWGGGLVGISNLDGMDASENETMSIRAFQPGRWYDIRLRITETRIEAWIDEERVVNVPTTGRTIGLRSGAIDSCRPLGVCSYDTDAELRNIQLRRLDPPGDGSGD
jgi:hypothetical protein